MGSITSNRFWRVLACAFAVAACLALAACGGGAASSSSSASGSDGSGGSASDSAPESLSAANPVDKFVGDWKFAAAEIEGLTVVGDFTGIMGTDLNMTLSLAADNTGTATFNDDTAEVTWEQAGDDAIAITPVKTDEDDITPMTATYADGVLTVHMADDEFEGDMYLTPDGTMEGLRDISAGNAVDVTSSDELVGTWKLSGVSMMGVMMYGDSDKLVEMMGDDASYAKLEIAADGTATIMGDDATWTVSSAGAAISFEGMDIPVKMLDGDLMIDMGALAGSLGFDMVMLFAK